MQSPMNSVLCLNITITREETEDWVTIRKTSRNDLETCSTFTVTLYYDDPLKASCIQLSIAYAELDNVYNYFNRKFQQEHKANPSAWPRMLQIETSPYHTNPLQTEKHWLLNAENTNHHDPKQNTLTSKQKADWVTF